MAKSRVAGVTEGPRSFVTRPAGKHKRTASVEISSFDGRVIIDRTADGFGCASFEVDGESLVGGKPHIAGVGAGLGLEPSQWAEIQREAIRGG